MTALEMLIAIIIRNPPIHQSTMSTSETLRKTEREHATLRREISAERRRRETGLVGGGGRGRGGAARGP